MNALRCWLSGSGGLDRMAKIRQSVTLLRMSVNAGPQPVRSQKFRVFQGFLSGQATQTFNTAHRCPTRPLTCPYRQS